MAYGLIKDSTMTALADSLRDKGIISKYKQVPTIDYYMSANATSLTDPTPTKKHTISSNYPLVTLNARPEAAKIKIVIDLGYYENPKNPKPDSAYITLMFIEKNTSATAAQNIIVNRASERRFELELPSTAVYICAYDTSSGDDDWIALNITAYALNSKGEQLSTDTEELNTLTPNEMTEAINNFDMPIAPPEAALAMTGNIQYKFANNGWNWFIDGYGDKVSTSNINILSFAFYLCSTLKHIPFVLNINDLTSMNSAFEACQELRECPKVRGSFRNSAPQNWDLRSIASCYLIRDFNDLFEPDMLNAVSNFKCTSAYTAPKMPIFESCYSMRNVPAWFYKHTLSADSTAIPSSTYSIYYRTFYNCYNLDEVRNIHVYNTAAAMTSSVISYFLNNTFRLKAFTFETDNGQPIVTKWKSQTLDLSSYIGYGSTSSYILNYNSGITADKKVTDDATYQALKNDPDWWTLDTAYSRYNYDSAVETINSLPDTSAYLAEAGGTNTIKFKENSGTKTDGGGITKENMVDAAAIAAAKGWTVAYA